MRRVLDAGRPSWRARQGSDREFHESIQQPLCAFDESHAGTIKIRVSVECDNSSGAHGTELTPHRMTIEIGDGTTSPGKVETARCYGNDIGIAFEDRFPGNRACRCAREFD